MLRIFKFRKKQERQGHEIDTNNSWTVSVNDKEAFFKRLLVLIPNDSVWAIEGIINPDLVQKLKQYEYVDELIVNKATLVPRQKTLKILINDKSRKDLIDNLTYRNLDWDIIHQHIYKNNTFYLSSYDCLHSACTWISQEFQESDFEVLIKSNKIELYKGNE